MLIRTITKHSDATNHLVEYNVQNKLMVCSQMHNQPLVMLKRNYELLKTQEKFVQCQEKRLQIETPSLKSSIKKYKNFQPLATIVVIMLM